MADRKLLKRSARRDGEEALPESLRPHLAVEPSCDWSQEDADSTNEAMRKFSSKRD